MTLYHAATGSCSFGPIWRGPRRSEGDHVRRSMNPWRPMGQGAAFHIPLVPAASFAFWAVGPEGLECTHNPFRGLDAGPSVKKPSSCPWLMGDHILCPCFLEPHPNPRLG